MYLHICLNVCLYIIYRYVLIYDSLNYQGTDCIEETDRCRRRDRQPAQFIGHKFKKKIKKIKFDEYYNINNSTYYQL